MADTDEIIDKALRVAETVEHIDRNVTHVKRMTEDALNEPTNADLRDLIERGEKTFIAHAKEDKLSFKEIRDTQEEIKTTLKGLPTKEQTEKMNSFLEKLDTGERIFSFGFNNSAKIVGFLLLIGGFFMLFKYGFVAAIAYLTGKQPL